MEDRLCQSAVRDKVVRVAYEKGPGHQVLDHFPESSRGVASLRCWNMLRLLRDSHVNLTGNWLKKCQTKCRRKVQSARRIQWLGLVKS